MLTSTVENYLKAILRLQEGGSGTATVGDIARELKVTPGTVTVMMRQLDGKGWIDYEPRRSVALNQAGIREARRVLRRHRLIESFLVEVMKLDWSQVHEEAEVLEHAISDRLLDRIDAMLGHPTHDPHGDPIPDPCGNVLPDLAVSLHFVEAGPYKVVRVSDGDEALLGWLHEKGLLIGEEIEVAHPDRAAGVWEIVRPCGTHLQLGEAAAKQVFVEPIS